MRKKGQVTAMKAVSLAKVPGKPTTGGTKLYGNPDVPEVFEWPSIVDEVDIYDLAFMGQVNLYELASALPENSLPKEGMLYFFYDLDAMAFSPFDETAARVIFYRGGKPLEELCLEDENGNSLSSPVVKLEMSAAAEDNAEGHKLFGLPLGYGEEKYPRPIEGWVMLMQIDSTAKVPFEDNGALCFFVEPEKLAAADFSDVRVMIVPRK